MRIGCESLVAGGSVQWLLRRNCSIAPRQAIIFYASLGLLSLAIGAFFWLRGAPLVIPFAGIEVLALGTALLFYARHAADSESIRLHPGRLTVRRVDGARFEQVEFVPAWVRVEPVGSDRSLVELSGQGRRIIVGRFVRPERRRELADELRWAIRRWQAPAAADVEASTTREESELKWQP